MNRGRQHARRAEREQETGRVQEIERWYKRESVCKKAIISE